MQQLTRPLGVAIALLLSGVPLFPEQLAQAQFSSPAGQGRPRGTAGGASRGEGAISDQAGCPQEAKRPEQLMAMAPTQTVGGTGSPQPTLWVYIPPTTAKTLEFSVFDEKQNGVYQTNLPIQSPGWFALPLSPEAAQLATGQSYWWAIAVVCDPSQRSKDWLVDGWIKYQPLPAQLQSQLTTAPAEQQVKLYLEAGFWYEAVHTFMELQRTEPNHPNATPLWTMLLKTAGLNVNAMPPRLTKAPR